MCTSTSNKDFFQLSDVYADHRDGFKPQANLSHVDDPNSNVPSVPPLITAKEPDENDIDDDDIGFTDSAWCCVVPNAPGSETQFTRTPVTGDGIDQELDHDENLAHEENSKEESVSPHDKNANYSINDDKPVHGRLWCIMVWMMTFGLYFFNGGTLAIM
jgi:hypothetical protein